MPRTFEWYQKAHYDKWPLERRRASQWLHCSLVAPRSCFYVSPVRAGELKVTNLKVREDSMALVRSLTESSLTPQTVGGGGQERRSRQLSHVWWWRTELHANPDSDSTPPTREGSFFAAGHHMKGKGGTGSREAPKNRTSHISQPTIHPEIGCPSTAGGERSGLCYKLEYTIRYHGKTSA